MENGKSVEESGHAPDGARRYTLTCIERTLRIEKVRYIIDIPQEIRGKLDYAIEAVGQGEFVNYTVELLDSKRTDEEIKGLRILKAMD